MDEINEALSRLIIALERQGIQRPTEVHLQGPRDINILSFMLREEYSVGVTSRSPQNAVTIQGVTFIWPCKEYQPRLDGNPIYL